MSKSRVTIASIVAVVLIVFLAGLFLFPRESEDQSSQERPQETATAVNLGFTYLPVTPGLSAYYNLGVDSGALVTEVTPDSLADKAGIKVGDVILSFNGSRVEEEARLLGMMMACPAGNRIALEVWREDITRIVELVHMAK